MKTPQSSPTAVGADSMPQVVPFYLPQFHPVAINDAAWGAGFTEWRNVVQARPLFRGHQQPDLPSELGYYDLRVPEIYSDQVALAKDHKISAFCFYHYWFQGREVLSRPLEYAASGPIDFPFMICWANESWNRAWDGLERDVILEQVYSENDDIIHAQRLVQLLRNRRYLTIRGRKPVLVYRPENHPRIEKLTELWLDAFHAAEVGAVDIYAVQSFETWDPRPSGFSGAVDFAPNWLAVPLAADVMRTRRIRAVGRIEPERDDRRDVLVARYADVASLHEARLTTDYPRLGCVAPGWDNTPRRRHGGAIVLAGGTSDRYREWLVHELRRARAEDSALVFVNAWNEWAEGAHLEPSLATGRQNLEATKAAIEQVEAEAFLQGAPGSTPESLEPLSATSVSEVLARQADLYEGRWSSFDRELHGTDEYRLSLLRGRISEPAIDIGAGDGMIARRIGLERVLSVDQETSGLTGLGSAVCARAEAVPVRDGAFRTAILCEVLEHVSDPLAVLEECSRIVAPGGTLLITVPAFPIATLESVWRRRKFGAAIRAHNVRDWDPEHERRLAEPELKRLLTRSGWQPLSVERFFSSPALAAIFGFERFANRAPSWRTLRKLGLRLAPQLERMTGRLEMGSEIFVIALNAK
jgi:SAM-dependent methyltransferase